MTRGGYVNILASKRNGTLYVGVTADLAARIWAHRCGTASSFTRRYRVTRLVYFEGHENIEAAISREKAAKKWKLQLIEAANPDWRNLWEDLSGSPLSRG